jgi:HD superfamily phosphohydrolase
MKHGWSLPELEALTSPTQVVRLPAQIEVPLTSRVRRLVDTAAFGRLRQISQLGLVSTVYPGATHTRFEHSLGVYRNALLYLRQLANDPIVRSLVSTEAAECFLVSALLHDIGHWPYCHPIEDLRVEGWPSHESVAKAHLELDEVANCLRSDWGMTPDRVVGLLTKSVTEPGDLILSSLLSGPIDVDKLDYLYRDSLHAGVPYGLQFDTQRIIASLCLDENKDRLAIIEKGRTAAELMVFARYIMFSEVYWHPVVRSATAMLQRAIYQLRDRLNPNEWFSMSDSDFRAMLIQVSSGTSVQGLVDGIFGQQRRLYKRVAQFTYFERPDLFERIRRRPYHYLCELSGRLAAELSDSIGIPVTGEDILVDAPPVGLEVQFRVNVKMERTGEFRRLGDISPVVEALATRQFDDWVKRVRFFVHPRIADRCSSSLVEEKLAQFA